MNQNDDYLIDSDLGLKLHRWGMKAAINTALSDGEKKGRVEEKTEIAREMKKDGESFEKIMKFTGLSKKEIDEL